MPKNVTEGVISLISTYPSRAAALKDIGENWSDLVERGVDLAAVTRAINDHFGRGG